MVFAHGSEIDFKPNIVIIVDASNLIYLLLHPVIHFLDTDYSCKKMDLDGDSLFKLRYIKCLMSSAE